MHRSAAVESRPVGGRMSDEHPQFQVRVGSASLMGALVKALLEQTAPGARVEIVRCVTEALGTGDVVVEQMESQRKMVIFGSTPSHELVAFHLASGSFSLLSVDASAEELRAAVQSLSVGPPVVSTGIVRALASISRGDGDHGARITSRERDVLALLQDGLSNGEIAERLSVSPNTVRSHLQSLSSKLGVTSRTKLAARARALGLS